MQIHDIQRIKGGLYARVICPDARIRQDIFDALSQADPLISAERKTIQRLADNDTVYTEIDRIRDKRIKGRVSTSGPKVKRAKKKLTAAEWDGRERLIAYNSRSAAA